MMTDNPNRLFSIQPTTRFERLRNQYMAFSSRPLPLYSIDVDRIITRVMRDTEGEAMILRRAKAFAAVVSEVPIEIFPDEPFVGWISGGLMRPCSARSKKEVSWERKWKLSPR